MLVLVLGTAITFSSCSKDDDDSSPAPTYLKGTWTATGGSWTYYITFDGNGNFDYHASTSRGSSSQAKGKYSYNASTHIITCEGASGTVYSDGEIRGGEWKAQYRYEESKMQIYNLTSELYFRKM